MGTNRVSTELINKVELTGAMGPPLQLVSCLLPQLDVCDFQCFLFSSLIYKFSEFRRNLETMGPMVIYFLAYGLVFFFKKKILSLFPTANDIIILQRKKNKDLLKPTK